jgi:hypothetical protein
MRRRRDRPRKHLRARHVAAHPVGWSHNGGYLAADPGPRDPSGIRSLADDGIHGTHPVANGKCARVPLRARFTVSARLSLELTVTRCRAHHGRAANRDDLHPVAESGVQNGASDSAGTGGVRAAFRRRFCRHRDRKMGRASWLHLPLRGVRDKSRRLADGIEHPSFEVGRRAQSTSTSRSAFNTREFGRCPSRRNQEGLTEFPQIADGRAP